MNRLAIFDCDGTLVDSGATIYAALGAAFAEHGLQLPPPEVSRRVIGLSLNEAMAALLPEASAEQHSALAEDYKRAFWQLRAAGKVEEPLFEGVIELLDALEADGWLLAVATGKSDRGLKHCLEPRNPCAIRVASDGGPPSVEAASVDGRAGDCRCRRGAGDELRRWRHKLRHGHGGLRGCGADRCGVGLS